MSMIESLNKLTHGVFIADNGKAFTGFYQGCTLLEMLLAQKTGLYKEVDELIHKPIIKYDGTQAEALDKSGRGVLSREQKAKNEFVEYECCFYHAPIMIYDHDLMKKLGNPEGIIDLVLQEKDDAMESVRNQLAQDGFSAHPDGSDYISGLMAICNDDLNTPYARRTPDQLKAQNGKRSWLGRRITTPDIISPALIDALVAEAKWGKGVATREGMKTSFPNTVLMSMKNFNALKDQARSMVALENAKNAELGFAGIRIGGVDVFPEDEEFLPSEKHVFAINTSRIGVMVHKDENFKVTSWQQVPDKKAKVQDVFVCLQMWTNGRPAHIVHTNVSDA